MINVRPKEKPRWYQFRKVLCRWLVNVARWIEPRSPEVDAFYIQQMQDMMITGRAITRIDPMDFYYTDRRGIYDPSHAPRPR